MMYVLVKDLFEYGEFMDEEMIVCSDSIEKLIVYCETLTQKKVHTKLIESEEGYSSRWSRGDGYFIKEIKVI